MCDTFHWLTQAMSNRSPAFLEDFIFCWLLLGPLLDFSTPQSTDYLLSIAVNNQAAYTKLLQPLSSQSQEKMSLLLSFISHYSQETVSRTVKLRASLVL